MPELITTTPTLYGKKSFSYMKANKAEIVPEMGNTHMLRFLVIQVL